MTHLILYIYWKNSIVLFTKSMKWLIFSSFPYVQVLCNDKDTKKVQVI